jgi:hypothetical protein
MMTKGAQPSGTDATVPMRAAAKGAPRRLADSAGVTAAAPVSERVA